MRVIYNNYMKILFLLIVFSLIGYLIYKNHISSVYRYTIRDGGYKIDKTFTINKTKKEILQAFNIDNIENQHDSLFKICYRNDDEIIFSVLINIKQKNTNTTIIKLDSLLGYSFSGMIDSTQEQKMVNGFSSKMFGDLFDKRVIIKLNDNKNIDESTFLYNFKLINK